MGQRPGRPALLRGVGLGRELPVPVGQAGRLPPGRDPAGHGRSAIPGAITDAGGLRSQFTHCIDIGPTILELAGLPQPTHVEGIAQTPMHGTSFLHTFADPAAEERHTQQYFEIYGYRAMYKDGWWLAQQIDRIPWDLTPDTIRKFAPGVWQPDNDRAELYYLPDDFTQANDLATSIRRKSGN